MSKWVLTAEAVDRLIELMDKRYSSTDAQQIFSYIMTDIAIGIGLAREYPDYSEKLLSAVGLNWDPLPLATEFVANVQLEEVD